MTVSESPWRQWWVFYIDPTEPQGSGWKHAGMIGGPNDADQAIAKTVGRMFNQPFWAFALDRGDFGSYYDLHYPPGYHNYDPKRIGPSGYRAIDSPNKGEK